MGNSLVPRKSGLTLAGKVGVGLVVCWVTMQVLPMVLGAGFVVALLGAAVVGMIASLLGSLLSITIYLGAPIFVLLLIMGMFSKDD